MIEMHLRDQIERAGPHEEVTVIVTWQDEPPFEAIKCRPIAERGVLLSRFYETQKRPVMKWLKNVPEVEVIDPLKGSGQAILAAPARVWRNIILQGESPLVSARVNLAPDARIYATELDA